MDVSTIDLNFFDQKGEIASYLLIHTGGVVLVDPGPETSLPALVSALENHGLTPHDVSHILLTHIHLDHAGSAGWFARQGATVYVHPDGVQHLLNPEKLVASASRLYGEWMDKLWGEVKSVPKEKLIEVHDEDEIVAGELHILALHTPGHAKHHVSYIYKDVIFSGDVGGVRFEPNKYVRLPFVPPETNLEMWRTSLERMINVGCKYIAPTHFGIFDDANAHLHRAIHFLKEVVVWLSKNMPGIHDVDSMGIRYAEFLHEYDLSFGLGESALAIYDRSDPIGFAASGLFRYWLKERSGT